MKVNAATGTLALIVLGVVVAGICAVLFLGAGSRAGTSDTPLSAARNGHQATRQLLNPIHLKGEMNIESAGNRELVSFEYWQDGELKRWRELVELTSRESDIPVKRVKEGVVRSSQITELLRADFQSRKQQDGSLRTIGRGDLATYFPWNLAGLNVQDSPVLTVSDVMASPEWDNRASDGVIEGEPVIHVVSRRTEPRASLETWLSPRHSYLPKRTLLYWGRRFSSSQAYQESQVVRWHAPQTDAGIVFPAEVVRTFVDNEGLVTTQRVSFETVTIGAALPPGTFDFAIPAGVRVGDRINNRIFVMGPDGQPSRNHPIEPLIQLPIGALQPPPAAKAPRDWTVWWVIGGVSVVVLGSWYFFRRRRATQRP